MENHLRRQREPRERNKEGIREQKSRDDRIFERHRVYRMGGERSVNSARGSLKSIRNEINIKAPHHRPWSILNHAINYVSLVNYTEWKRFHERFVADPRRENNEQNNLA